MRAALKSSLCFLCLGCVSARTSFGEVGRKDNLARRLHRRHLAAGGIAYDDVSGDNEAEVCRSFRDVYFDAKVVETFGTECSCQAADLNGTGYAVTCADRCEHCFDGACALFALELNLERKEDGEFWAIYERTCNDYGDGSFDGIKFCRESDFRGSEVIDRYLVNGAACASVSPVRCDEEDNIFSDFIDCSNLGYSNSMDLCNLTNAEGPFEHYSTFDVDMAQPSCPNGLSGKSGASRTLPIYGLFEIALFYMAS
uniref:Uncharacterized protein n=1 Tax=Pseudictyota dubia TaxID=2749911 RepID=A0A7R9W075_9STRA